jgi:hypothetical protein
MRTRTLVGTVGQTFVLNVSHGRENRPKNEEQNSPPKKLTESYAWA